MTEINPKEYVEMRLSAGDKPLLYAKTARVMARVGIVGEKIVTKMSDGHIETTNTVKSEGDMVITNPTGEEYIISAEIFAKRYEIDPANQKLYRPKGGAQQFLFLKEDVEFIAPWGEKQSVKKGGVLSISGRDSGDIYGIQRKEFLETYAPCDKNGNIINFIPQKAKTR